MSILERIPSELRSRRRVFLTLESGRAYFRRSSILNSMTTLNFQFAATLLDSFLDSALQDDILQFNDVDMDVLDAIVDMLPPLALPIAVEPTMPAMEPRFQQELTTDACVHYDMASIPPLDLLNASFNEDWHLEDQDVALLQGKILVVEMPVLVERGVQEIKRRNAGHIKMDAGVRSRVL
ncbi:hypothetical protein AC1031_020876 [Aphanomyces cochlioides]|nr:hypothetical protein AC1031_020876 [Aphanomyces cochlioides]